MTAPSIRRAVSLLPSCATTGIGSLPHTQLELGLQLALQVDIPYLPQLPSQNPAELMIPAALEGFPGAVFDPEGMATIVVDHWREARTGFGERLELALQSGQLEAFEPTPSANRAWRPFLWEVEHRKLALAKVQLAGPATVRWVTQTTAGTVAAQVPELDQQLFRLILARALAMVKAVRRAGATPILYLDEPGLYALNLQDPTHLLVLQELKVLVAALQREGALVGIHCCGNTRWPAVLGLGADLISLDVRLSLDALVEDQAAFEAFLATGATLSLGIIPTNLDARYEVRNLVDSVEATLRATLKTDRRFQEVLGRCVLTPACGLALRNIVDVERVFEDLRAAQKRLIASSK
ncbi:MAG: hypothetical protein M3Y59_15820 [Myxococcota bacterium]|nr:hypothetical protein [Myxococcota bacterium]